jgi:prephenate dehydratase
MTDPAPAPCEVAYLGPEGSFSHLVAQKRFPGQALCPQEKIVRDFNCSLHNIATHIA